MLQRRISDFLMLREWVVMRTHGNKYQSGFPDLYCFHHTYGPRWIEIKRKTGARFTPAQMEFFPHINNVWVMTEPTEHAYSKLFKDPNWALFINLNHNIKDYAPQQLDLPTNTEGLIQKALIQELEDNGYVVMPTFGSIYQKGFPDLLALRLGTSKWIEVKVSPQSCVFTPNQKKYFPLMHACRIGIWILDGPGQLHKLSEPPNWEQYKTKETFWY